MADTGLATRGPARHAVGARRATLGGLTQVGRRVRALLVVDSLARGLRR